jgi:hypothetical protein
MPIGEGRCPFLPIMSLSENRYIFQTSGFAGGIVTSAL